MGGRGNEFSLQFASGHFVSKERTQFLDAVRLMSRTPAKSNEKQEKLSATQVVISKGEKKPSDTTHSNITESDTHQEISEDVRV